MPTRGKLTGHARPIASHSMNSWSFAAAAFLLLSPVVARADEATPPPADQAEAPAKPPDATKRFFVHANVAFNVYTYVGPLGTKPATYYTPGSGGVGITKGRAALFEQLGFGYLVQEHLRLQLAAVTGEYLTNVPAAPANEFAVAGAIAWAVFIEGPYWIGAGPVLAGRSSGLAHFDVGLFAATGWAFPLGAGFSLSPIIQMLSFFYQRTTVGISPCLSLGYRF